MFSVTFVGHQGWLFASDRARVLFDGLLVEPFGHKGLVGRVFPPRALDVARFPALDAVFVSHEHEDHFNVPSLNRLERAVPLYLSARSSTAARAIVAEMGFTRVAFFEPDVPLTIGDLELHFFSPDFVRENHSDE
jgi:L-ascorbate metabolism protein UlaG (beta-lactamase superfamily)